MNVIKLKDMIPGDKMSLSAYNELTQLLNSNKELLKIKQRYKKKIKNDSSSSSNKGFIDEKT